MMNERIKKLADTALDKAVPETWTTLSYDQLMKFQKTFAELIAMECISICENLGDKGMDGHYCADEIFKHFGIQK